MIDFKHVSKNYGGQVIFNQADCRANQGEHIGIVGPNGSGKTTLFKIITGEVEVDEGELAMPRDVRIGYLRQQLSEEVFGLSLLDFTADAIPEVTSMAAELHDIEHRLATVNLSDTERKKALHQHGVLQSNFEHLGGYRLRSDAEITLSGLGFQPDQFLHPMQAFSGGWQMRAALARTLIANPDILLLDEPSNYLDIPAVEWLCRLLRSYQGTLLLISHDRYLLRKLTTTTWEINGGSITRFAGNYDFYVRERHERRLTLVSAKRNQDRKREQLERNIERFRAKSSKASQAQSWRKQLAKMDEVNLPDELHFIGSIRLPEPPPCGAEAARFEQVSFSYPESAPIISDVDLQIESGDKIAFVGYNGTGKTTLLKLLCGILKPDSGRVICGHNIVAGYQAQEFSEILPPESSVYDVVRTVAGGERLRATLPAVLGSFGFGADSMTKPCQALSGGEKIRLCFARIFANPPNLLILDEPTTHLDIAAREALQQALRQYSGTVCLVSHDIEFIRQVADTIIAMRTPGIKKYFGNYDYYLEKASEETAIGTETSNTSNDNHKRKDQRREAARHRQKKSGKQKQTRRKVSELEELLEQLTEERDQLLQNIASPEPSFDFSAANRYLHGLQQQIERASSQWETLAGQLEES